MAGSKLTALAALTGNPTLEDLMYVVDDPDGTPVSHSTTVGALLALTGTSCLTNASSATDTSIVVQGLPPGWTTYSGFIVIDPYTVECEIRRIETLTDTTIGFTGALDYAHATDDAVLFTEQALANIVWFGAKGDSSTENQDDFFDLAIIQLDEYLLGGICYAPGGTYIMTENVKMQGRDYIHIMGDGPNATILKWVNGASDSAGADNIFRLSAGNDHVTIENMTLDGNRDNVTKTDALIHISSTTYYTKIHNVHFVDGYEDAIYIHDDAADIQIINCSFYGMDRSAIVIIDGSRIVIDGNIMSRCDNTYVDLENNDVADIINKVVISNNVFYDDDAGHNAAPFSMTGGGTNSELVITGNVGSLMGGIGLIGGGSVNISNNAFKCKISGSYGLSVRADYSVVQSNVFEDIGTATGEAEVIELRSGDYMSFKDNYIITGDNHGVKTESITHTDIIGNTILSAYGTGIYVDEAEHVNISENHVVSSGDMGIYIKRTGDFIVSGNIVKDSTGEGIYIENSSVNGIVSDNIVMNGAKEGFVIAGDYIQLVNNLAYDDQGTKTQTYGLNITAEADYLTIMGNDFTNNKTGSTTGSTPTNYRPNPNGTYATDLADFNFT